jgi:hypothetical protein
LAVVEAQGLAVGGKVDGGGGDAVEFGKGGNGGVPPGHSLAIALNVYLDKECVHLGALFWGHFWDRWVLENAAVEELHDVEVCANNLFILTQTEGFWDWDICVFEGVDDPVFAVNFVCCLEMY